MGFFDMIGKSNNNDEIKAERRNMNFAREQQAFQAGAYDDQIFLQEKKQQEDLVRWQQDIDDEIENLKHELKNEMYHPERGWVKKKMLATNKDGIVLRDKETGKPLFKQMPAMCNDLCISKIETLIRPLCNRNMMMSNLTEKRILTILRKTADDLVDDLTENYLFYELDKCNASIITNLSGIKRIVLNFIVSAPYRAMNDGERKHLRTMNKRIESFNESISTPERGKKMFGLLG